MQKLDHMDFYIVFDPRQKLMSVSTFVFYFCVLFVQFKKFSYGWNGGIIIIIFTFLIRGKRKVEIYQET